jgi:transposase
VELFVGVDWAEDHHDVCVVNAGGRVVAKGRVPQGIAGVARLHELVDLERDDLKAPVEVVVGIETDRGLLVRALLAAGYAVVAVNPMAVDRYRDRHRVSGAKSDPGDARVLADLPPDRWVLVMPSTACTRATTSLPSSSRLRASARTITS